MRLYTTALISLFKILSDLYALPDFYTFFLAKQSKSEEFSVFHIAPICFLLDILFGSYFCMFFAVDFIAYTLFSFLNIKNAFVLYLIRYLGLFFIGCSLFQILSGLCWGVFFTLFFYEQN